MKTIYFAGGCFWGMEAFIKKLPGVRETAVGYANGTKANPTYEEVCSHTTGHAETVRVVYDPSQITLEMLLKAFFKVVDPTELNRQGGDVGEQYRNGIYYTDEEDRKTIEAAIRAVREKYDQPVVTECRKLVCFYDAEEYHQDYLDKNPTGYCHINLLDAEEFIEEEMGETWKLITKEIGDPDPYARVKEKYNTLLLQAKSELRNAILQVENSFLAALRLAVAGNQIDFAGRREVSFILKEVYHCMEQELVIDDSTGLLRELEKTRKLLYLGDNCGEIVLDKLFIEMIRKRYPNLTVLYGVRGRPVVNDVTLEDARMVGMERVARIIENGSGALGTVLNETSPEFQEIFKTADLVISKGQGNFESLSECRDQQIYYLLMIKCERVSRALKGP